MSIKLILGKGIGSTREFDEVLVDKVIRCLTEKAGTLIKFF